MSGNKIRVLVVDDSAVIRQILADCLGEIADIEVVGTAANGQRGLELCRSLTPDVVTLDIQMPGMDGLAALDAILADRPTPVVMVSALTQLGAGVTLDALERGAIDYVAKPESRLEVQEVFREDLPRKIRAAAGVDVRRILEIRKQRRLRREAKRAAPAKTVLPADANWLADKCIAIGVSTGGPPALTCLFESLTPPMPPIVIVQHMPAQFTKPLAWRLNSLSKLSIKEAETGDALRPNHVFIAPGAFHMEVRGSAQRPTLLIRDGDPVSSHKPSVDVLMQTAAGVFGADCLGVIMTGMGRDGVAGCCAIRQAGGIVYGQDEETSDVYGMNKVAFVEGHVDRQFALDEAATLLSRHVARHWRRDPVATR